MDGTITIVGNVGAEPRQRELPSGGRVTSFSVAVTPRRYDRSAETWVDAATTWFDIAAFRRLGEHAYRSLARGQRVIVTGKVGLRTWDNGAALQITADAIGPDLQWGTTTFAKSSDPRDASHAEEHAHPARSAPEPVNGVARSASGTSAEGGAAAADRAAPAIGHITEETRGVELDGWAPESPF